ncbi:MAG: hypothetical protein EHM91_06495, partial [Planctomycetota bacterium]
YLGGAGGFQIVSLTAATLSSILLAAAIAVWTSCAGRSMYSSVAGAIAVYGMMLAAAAGPSGMLAILGIDLFPFVHPWGSALACLSETSFGGEVGWMSSGLLSLVVAGLVLMASATRLLAPDAIAPRQVRASRDIEDREEYAQNAVENLGFQSVQHRVWERFPLLWKEIRTRAAAQISYEARLIVGGSLVLVMLCTLMMERGDQLKMFQAFVPIAGLLAVAGGAGLFTRDREDRRWEPILGAPVSSRRIIAAKLLSGPASPEGAVLIALTLLSLAPFAQVWSSLRSAGTALGLFLLFAYCLAALASLVSRTQRTAMLLAGSVITAIPFALSTLNPYSYFHLRTAPSVAIYFLVYASAVVLLVYLILAVFRVVTGRP